MEGLGTFRNHASQTSTMPSPLTDADYNALSGALDRQNERDSLLVGNIAKWKATSEAACALEKTCRDNMIAAYFFGGVCRDCWNGKAPRDIDIVVDDAFWEEFNKAAAAHKPRANRFGGLKFSLHGTSVDAWPIAKTWTFANGLSRPTAVTQLPETTFLNIESVVAMVWHPEEPWVFQKGFYRAMESRTLEIQNFNNPHPALCIARIRKFVERDGWIPGDSVKAFELNYFKEGGKESDIVAATKVHYGDGVVLQGTSGARALSSDAKSGIARRA